MDERVESPTNELEEAISAVLNSSPDEVELRRDAISTLAQSRVAVLLDQPWDGQSMPDESMRLQLVSDGPNQQQAMLAVFSSQDRAEQFQREHGGFSHATMVDAAWALLGVAKGDGVMVNPNQEISFRVDPQIAEILRSTVEKVLEQQASNDAFSGPQQ